MERKRKAVLFDNKVELTVVRKGAIADAKEDTVAETKSLTFFLPTSENARCLTTYLKRCLEEREYTVDLFYDSPDGFVSLYRNGPATISKSEAKFKGLQAIREKSASTKLTLRIYRDECYGGDMTLVFYFYATSDLAIMGHLLWTGLGRVYKTIECERRSKATGDWVPCDPSGFCDKSIALAVNKLSEKQKVLALDFINSLSNEKTT